MVPIGIQNTKGIESGVSLTLRSRAFDGVIHLSVLVCQARSMLIYQSKSTQSTGASVEGSIPSED